MASGFWNILMRRTPDPSFFEKAVLDNQRKSDVSSVKASVDRLQVLLAAVKNDRSPESD
jgi:hypothetical protein